MTNIKYFGFAKASSSAPILSHNLLTDAPDEIHLEVSKVLTKLKEFDLRPDQRQKIKSQLGCWHCKKDLKGIIYFSLCSPNYPDRHIYAAINQVRDHLAKLEDYETEPDSTLRLHCKSFVEDICRDFENLKGFDKISVIGNTLSEVTDQARRNTSKIIQNIVEVQKINDKAENLRNQAMQFEATAHEVSQKTGRRSLKVKIIFVIAALSLILLIILPSATNAD